MSDITEVAVEAARLIRAGWTTGTLARDGNGDAVDPLALDATCFCAVGALTRAAHNAGLGGWNQSVLALRKNLASTVGARSVAAWNDRPGVDAEQVASTIERVAQEMVAS